MKYKFLIIFILFTLFFVLKNPVFNYYVSKQNDRKIQKIKDINIQNAYNFTSFVQDIEQKTSWKVYITSTYRSFEEQTKLKKQDSRNASAGNSKHNFAKAIDIILYRNTFWGQVWIIKGSKKERWLSTNVVEIATKNKLIWGGNFLKYYDPVHFEIK